MYSKTYRPTPTVKERQAVIRRQRVMETSIQETIKGEGCLYNTAQVLYLDIHEPGASFHRGFGAWIYLPCWGRTDVGNRYSAAPTTSRLLCTLSYLCTYSPIYSLMHYPPCSLIYSSTHSMQYPTRSLIYQFTRQSTDLLIHSLIHSPNHSSPAHSPIHSSTHCSTHTFIHIRTNVLTSTRRLTCGLATGFYKPREAKRARRGLDFHLGFKTYSQTISL
jgi:hypothetical protein